MVYGEIAAVMSKATGKTVVYKRISLEDFKKSLLFILDFFVQGSSYQAEFGYFGPDSKSWLLGPRRPHEADSRLLKSISRHILFSSHKLAAIKP
jgi:hypothetical protein